MPWWFHVVESKHEFQNPTSAEKIRALGETLELNAEMRVLDLGAGRGGPAVVLAETFRCHVTCVERSDEFLAAARERADRAGVGSLVELVHADAKGLPLETRYDRVLCLGASFVWGGLAETVEALAPAVAPGGFLAVGEPFWRRWPLPDGFEPEEGYDFLPLNETGTLFEGGGIELVTIIASSQDDWDRYESLKWRTLEEWLHDNPDEAEAEEFRAAGRRERELYLQWYRDLLGWAIFVGRKR